LTTKASLIPCWHNNTGTTISLGTAQSSPITLRGNSSLRSNALTARISRSPSIPSSPSRSRYLTKTSQALFSTWFFEILLNYP
jgi:hypothetical protein